MSMKTSDLEDQVTCPVCKEIPHDGPIFQCANGHLICQGCYDNLPIYGTSKNCPTCRGNYHVGADGKPQKSILAAGIVEAIALPCKNSNKGCPVVLKKSLLSCHVEHCEYSMVPCINSEHGCEEKLLAKDLRDHLKTSCNFRIVTCRNSAQGCTFKGTIHDNSTHEQKCEHKLVQCPLCKMKIVMADAPWHIIMKHDAKVSMNSHVLKLENEQNKQILKQSQICLVQHQSRKWFLGTVIQQGSECRASITFLGPSACLPPDLQASIFLQYIGKYKGVNWSGEACAIDEKEWTNGICLTWPNDTKYFWLDATFSVQSTETAIVQQIKGPALQNITDMSKRMEDLETSTRLVKELKKLSLNELEKTELNKKLAQKRSMEAALSLGADVNAKDERGRTALHTFIHNAEAVSFLISKGANVNLQTNKGETPLYLVHNTECAALLVKAGAKANIVNEEGKTPLHKIAGRAHWFEPLSMVRLLLEQFPGIVHLRDRHGKTALTLARESKNSKTVDLLLSRGASE